MCNFGYNFSNFGFSEKRDTRREIQTNFLIMIERKNDKICHENSGNANFEQNYFVKLKQQMKCNHD